MGFLTFKGKSSLEINRLRGRGEEDEEEGR
jgi:hypothetical protein